MTRTRRCRFCLAPLFVAAAVLPAPGQVPETIPTENPYAIGTFESLGIYYRSPDVGQAAVRFREVGAAEWRDGLPLWHDGRADEYRGSLVHLRPGTVYEIELRTGGRTVSLSGRTRGGDFPVGKTTTVPAGDSYEPIFVTESGTRDAWHLVTVPDGRKATLDAANEIEVNVTVDADYVIIRGLELRNAARHGILIRAGRHDVVVEDSRITGWGRGGGGLTYGGLGNMDSAIYAEEGTRNLVVQRNLLEHPRGGSNDWRTGHPAGPQAVSIRESGGGNIIRYNTIRSSEDHGFNDAIGGSSNQSAVGNVQRDSDVYGNYIRNVWDDAIEVEGGNMNVRVWGNFIEKTTMHIATAATTLGPIYIFRNVLGESRLNPEDPRGGYLMKVGEIPGFGGGIRYLFHNTALQPRGGSHAFSGHGDPTADSRNNIWDVPGMLFHNRVPEEFPLSRFDHDVFMGLVVGVPDIPGRVETTPAFVESERLEFYPSTWTDVVERGWVELRRPEGRIQRVNGPVVVRPNLTIDHGMRIPNFNDDYAGEAPDLGAFEVGRPPLLFGREGIRPPRTLGVRSADFILVSLSTTTSDHGTA